MRKAIIYLVPAQLATQLRYGRVPASVQFALLAVAALVYALGGRPALMGPSSSPATKRFALLHLVIGLAGLVAAYRANGGARGRDFATRYIMLATVLTGWVFGAYVIVFYSAWYLLCPMIGAPAVSLFEAGGPIQFGLWLVAGTIFVRLLYRYVAIAALGDAG